MPLVARQPRQDSYLGRAHPEGPPGARVRDVPNDSEELIPPRSCNENGYRCLVCTLCRTEESAPNRPKVSSLTRTFTILTTVLTSLAVAVPIALALHMFPSFHETEAAAHVLGNRTSLVDQVPHRGPGQVFIEYCSSDGHREAYNRVSQMLESCRKCQLEVLGEETLIPIQQRVKAHSVFAVQVACYVIIFAGEQLFGMPEITAPNKFIFFMFVWMVGNAVRCKLVYTGVFEIFLEGKLLWSSLQKSHLPETGDIVLAFHGAGVDILNG